MGDDNVVDIGSKRPPVDGDVRDGVISIFVHAMNSMSKARVDEVRALQRALQRKARQRLKLRAKIARWERVSRMNAWPERAHLVAMAIAYVEALPPGEGLDTSDPLLRAELLHGLREAKAAYLATFDGEAKGGDDG